MFIISTTRRNYWDEYLSSKRIISIRNGKKKIKLQRYGSKKNLFSE